MKGLTGLIRFDHEGFRTDFSLDIVELTEKGLQNKGTWNSTDGVKLMIPTEHQNISELQDLRNMTFIVLIALVS